MLTGGHKPHDVTQHIDTAVPVRTLADIMHSSVSYQNPNLNLILTLKPETEFEASNNSLKVDQRSFLPLHFLTDLYKY